MCIAFGKQNNLREAKNKMEKELLVEPLGRRADSRWYCIVLERQGKEMGTYSPLCFLMAREQM